MKKTQWIAIGAGSALLVAAALAANTYAPGSRIQILSHNAYPDHGKFADRLDRTIAAGVPFAVEEDLAWIDGRSHVIHGAKNAAADDPTWKAISSRRSNRSWRRP